MDPNPNNFPILSYVMEKIPSIKRAMGTKAEEYDIEQPRTQTRASSSDEPHFELAEKMPHLKDPKILSEMHLAVADVAQKRSVLKMLGERPNHEAVDNAKVQLAEIQADLSRQWDNVVLLSQGEVKGEKKGKTREELERDMQIFKSVISLDEMHEAYEKMLEEAELRLQKIYDAAVSGNNLVELEKEASVEADEVNEEVVVILKQVEDRVALEKVDLSCRQLKLLPEAFGKVKSLVVLDLSNNQLEAIPDSIAGLENLEKLYLSTNLLEALPDSVGLLFKLKLLDVSGNKLTALPDSISHCRSLVELNASFNKITYLPTNIGYELVNLRILSVPLNKIRHLPFSIGEMKSLQCLDLHFNELHGVPPSIGRLSKLEILNLSSNFSDLTELPSTIGDLTNLKELDVSNNQIHELPDTFCQLENLRKLNVEHNPLVVPPTEIANEGVEAVKAYLIKRRLDMLREEERMSTFEETDETNASILTRSTSWLNNFVANVSGTVSGYLGSTGNSNKDPYLNQQF